VEPAGAEVTAGRLRVGVAFATTGAAEAIGGRVAAATVGVDKSIGVAKGVGAPSAERVQALRISMAKTTAKRIKVRFIISLLFGGVDPTKLILSLRPVAAKRINSFRTKLAVSALPGYVFGA
jgi:hypothetical protein